MPLTHLWPSHACRYAVDLVVCVALGCDMFDCVFPTRTAVSSVYLRCCKITWKLPSCTNLLFFVCLFSEVRLSLGALGISPSEAKAVCQRLPAHRPRLPVSHLQEVSREQNVVDCGATFVKPFLLHLGKEVKKTTLTKYSHNKGTVCFEKTFTCMQVICLFVFFLFQT